MMVSPPGSPEGGMRRPQSMYNPQSPEVGVKSRPQSMISRNVRSQSRMSQSSRHGESKMSEDDGKTAVRVVVRMRPPLGPTDPGFDLIPQRFQRSTVTVTTSTSLGVDSPQGRKIFIFDRVFGEEVIQRGIWDYLQDSVDSFLQGYNVSILAYGQSGSGKSYTMGTSGPDDQIDPSSMGVIPRAAAHLFDNLKGGSAASLSRQTSGLKTPTRYSVGNLANVLQNSQLTKIGGDKKCELSVTYVEIYNEQLRDLLLPEATPQAERPTVQIREDVKGHIYAEGLRSVPINTIDELLAVLNHGSTIRQTDATAINAKSSRSHAVFTVNLKQVKAQSSMTTPQGKRSSVALDAMANGDSNITVESKLHFVDLAGSERMKNTGATGDRAREGISINAGLASLGKVISQLSTRSAGSHVSYRDSKLTRLLQDSLGGNAITYMIACVTPAEFHLNETLNTVQYAQRARNIQSKPRIQQISDDADKQAVIDRLRTEVAFLRQQIRSTESGDRRNGVHNERPDRTNEREIELQHELLDVHENYTTLSQRHAKLISELTRSTEVNGDAGAGHAPNEGAMDRLKRSQANQAQIEQVVMEYEKTIQSLEANLSTTRSSLANTESSLLERETKLAYIETMNQQLHSRCQKLMDRESSTEQYLKDLEAKLDGENSGGARTDAVVAALRKEIANVRESQTNAEDYITTLEERLAEADQDMELMQREVERLDHLVERQRSLGKLDNLLYELDHIQKEGRTSQPLKVPATTKDAEHDRALETLKEAEETELPAESENELDPSPTKHGRAFITNNTDSGLQALENATDVPMPEPLVPRRESPQPSPAQSKFMTEKFEEVTQELFDLRLEHESTMTEFDLLEAKYHEALRTLAEMQDAADEGHQSSRDNASPSESFLEDARVHELKNGGPVSSSRSLSSELSLAGESHSSVDMPETMPATKMADPDEVTSQEIDRLQQLLAEHERGLNTVSQQYADLQAEHQDTLRAVDTLRSEVQKSRLGVREPGSPTVLAPGMLRRMSSQISSVDRGHRSISSLRTLIAEEFDGKADRLEGAEVHLSTAANEMQSRMERIQHLEAENKSVKKEMEMKSTIIAGLTRERDRTSMKTASPVDLSMVSQMRDQLIQKETQLKALHEGYAAREQELQGEITALKAQTTNNEGLKVADRDTVSDPDEKLKGLQHQLEKLSARHRSAQETTEALRTEHDTAKTELVASLATIEALKAQQGVLSEDKSDALFEKAAAAHAIQVERDNYRDLVENLKGQVEEHKSTATSQSAIISELEIQRSDLQTQLDEHQETVETQTEQIKAQLAQITMLETKVEEAQSAVVFHKHGLKSLHDTHATVMEEMKLSHAGQMAEYDDRLSEHNKKAESLEQQLSKSKIRLEELVAGAQNALDHPTSADLLVNHIHDLSEEKGAMVDSNARLTATNVELDRQLTGRQSLQELEEELKKTDERMSNYKETIRSLANEVGNHEETLRANAQTISKHTAAIETLKAEKQKKDSLIEELEQQLHSSFDQHNRRLSTNHQALAEAQKRISNLEKEIDVRRSYADGEVLAPHGGTTKSLGRPHSPMTDSQQRSNSMTSNLRKSASVASLPSPPPSVPLPPLPSLPAGVMNTANPSPPNSRHTSKELTAPQQHHGQAHSPSSPYFPPNITSNTDKTGTTNNSVLTRESARQSALIEEQESKLRTLEKRLMAEKKLTASLEDALIDLETHGNKIRADADGWKKKAWAAEEEVKRNQDELSGMRKERRSERLSVQQVEEERGKRVEAERAREVLEERMRALGMAGGSGQGGLDGKKKKRKGGGLNCF